MNLNQKIIELLISEDYQSRLPQVGGEAIQVFISHVADTGDIFVQKETNTFTIIPTNIPTIITITNATTNTITIISTNIPTIITISYAITSIPITNIPTSIPTSNYPHQQW